MFFLKKFECRIRGGVESKHGKANVLLQTFVSRAKVDTFSLVADLNYVAQARSCRSIIRSGPQSSDCFHPC